jgi:hypothetical protein
MKGNSINGCDFLKFVIYVGEGGIVITRPARQKAQQRHWL